MREAHSHEEMMALKREMMAMKRQTASALKTAKFGIWKRPLYGDNALSRRVWRLSAYKS